MKDKIRRNIYILVLLILFLIASICIQYPTWTKHNENIENIVEVVETEKENQEENNNTIEIQDEKTEETYTVILPEELKKEETPIVQEPQPQVQQEPQGSFTGYLTHYGPDCAGCSGVTVSGYDVRGTIYYNDSQYGQLRVVALSRDYPLYTVIRMNNYKGGEIYAIALDWGGAITGTRIDLLVSSEGEASRLGVQSDVSVDIIRWGK